MQNTARERCAVEKCVYRKGVIKKDWVTKSPWSPIYDVHRVSSRVGLVTGAMVFLTSLFSF